MKLKHWYDMFQVILNANSIVQYIIQIKNGMKKHVNVSVKVAIHAKKVIVGIAGHVFARAASM